MRVGHGLRVGAAMMAVLVVAVPASAADKPRPKIRDAKAISKLQPTKRDGAAAVDGFTEQMQAFKQAVAVRKAAVESINQTFATAVNTAQRAFKDARAAATTAEAKNAADAARKQAIADATAARQAALNALGPEPTLPEKSTPAPTRTR